MQMGLQAGFGNDLTDVLPGIKAQGCEIVRIDLQFVSSHEVGRDLAQQVLDVGMSPLCIVAKPEVIAYLPQGSIVESGNERNIGLDGFSKDPKVYWETEAAPAIAYCKDYNLPLYIGAIANLNKEGLAFLRALPWKDVPEWVGLAHHWYPDDDLPHKSHLGQTIWQLKIPPYYTKLQTRHQDFLDVKGIVGERPMALTETGWWDSPTRSEDTVANWYREEREMYGPEGYKILIAYQLKNAKPPSDPNLWQPEHGYGFTDYGTGQWKSRSKAWFGG